jgi:predicted amidohydrolase
MRIFGAQIAPTSNNVAHNLELHLEFAAQAMNHKADILFFPELSLTGYEPTMAADLALAANDERLMLFQKFVDVGDLMLAVGLPLRTAKGIQIAVAIYRKGAPVRFYAKQLLHEDEMPFFVAGEKPCFIENGTMTIMPAICYESLQPCHIEQRCRKGIDLYAASVAKSENGVQKAVKQFPITASKHKVPIMMVNSVGPYVNFTAAGQSGIWSATGELMTVMNSTESGLIGYDTESGKVIC